MSFHQKTTKYAVVVFNNGRLVQNLVEREIDFWGFIMATFQITIDDHVKKEADKLFFSLGLDTDTAINIFLKASIENEGLPFPVKHNKYSKDFMEAIKDCQEMENLHGPFDSAEEAVASMLED